MNFVLPGSGYLYNKSIDSKAMGYNKSKSKSKVTVPPVNTGGGNNNSSSTVLPGYSNYSTYEWINTHTKNKTHSFTNRCF